MTEYLERIGSGFHHDLWMVRLDGAFGQAQVYNGIDRDWERTVEQATQPWLGFTHEHVIPLLSLSSTSERLVIVHGDERGPTVFKMASLLTDAGERMRWAIEEIAGVAEAIATMAWRQPGFVHRRACYEQIVVGTDGHARLRAPVAQVAWGTAGGFTGRGNSLKASVRYMAPEQVRGCPTTPATDVHALAGTLYAMLTGRPPFPGDTDMDALMAIHTHKLPEPPPAVPRALADLVMRGLAPDAADRPATPALFAAELRRCAPGPVPPGLLAKVAMLRPDTRPAPHASELIVGNRCAKQWDELTQTSTQGVRHCEQCKHDVVHVRSLLALIPLLGARCVAFKPDDGTS